MNNFIHAQGRLEHTLCGDAFDAYESGDSDKPIVIGQVGDIVTCPICKIEIDYVMETFKKYKVIK